MAAAAPSPYAFCFTSVQGGTLRSLFELLSVIVHDVSVVVSKEGIKVLTADGVRNILIWLRLSPEGFEHYESNGLHRVGLNVSAVHKLLKTAASHDTISMFMLKDRTETLGIRISNPEKRITTEFTMSLLDVNFETITCPDVAFEAVVTLPSAFFQRLCRDASHLSEHLVLSVDRTSCTFACSSDAASQKTVIEPTVDGKHVVTITWAEQAGTEQGGTEPGGGQLEPIVGRYALRFLTCFAKATALSPQLELYFKRDYPLVMQFSISSLGTLRFALANLAASVD